MKEEQEVSQFKLQSNHMQILLDKANTHSTYH